MSVLLAFKITQSDEEATSCILVVAFIVQTADAIIYNGEMDTTSMTIKIIDIELKSRKKKGKKKKKKNLLSKFNNSRQQCTA